MVFDRNKVLWTIVQHSRCGYGGDKTFHNFLEERIIMNQKELDKVKKSGGLILEDYATADAWTTAPHARHKGVFSRSKIDGLKIYVPLKIMVGRESHSDDPLINSYRKFTNTNCRVEN